MTAARAALTPSTCPTGRCSVPSLETLQTEARTARLLREAREQDRRSAAKLAAAAERLRSAADALHQMTGDASPRALAPAMVSDGQQVPRAVAGTRGGHSAADPVTYSHAREVCR